MTYDYRLQVYVDDKFIIQGCGHPASMKPNCCNANKYAGKTLSQAYSIELRAKLAH